MKHLTSVFCGLVLAAGLTTAASAAEVTIRIGHIAEPVHPYGQGADYFAKRVGELSNGEIDVRVFPSSQLGGQKDLIEGLIYGTVDMALVGTAELGQFQPQISIFDLPFLFEDLDHAYRSLDTVGMDLGEALEPRGIKLLGYMENGIRHLTNNIHPVATPADLDGLKIRVMNNEIYIDMVRELGASPTPMALDELYSAMQQGIVDGQENPSAHIFTKRFYEVQHYASLTAHAYAPEPMLISMIAWGRLDDAQREIVQQAASEAIAWQRALSAEMDEQYWDKIRETGLMEVTEVDRAAFAEASRPVYEHFAEMVGQENLDRIEALKASN